MVVNLPRGTRYEEKRSISGNGVEVRWDVTLSNFRVVVHV